MNTLWTILLPLVDKTPNPDDVKPGWLAFLIFLLLAAAVVFLWFSLRKHLGRVHFDDPDRSDGPSEGAPPTT